MRSFDRLIRVDRSQRYDLITAIMGRNACEQDCALPGATMRAYKIQIERNPASHWASHEQYASLQSKRFVLLYRKAVRFGHETKVASH